MKTDEALKILEANRNERAIFTSDPKNGDRITITPEGPESVENLILTLDFGAYEGDGPEVTKI